MTLRELIAHLTKFGEENGFDLPVMNHDQDTSWLLPFNADREFLKVDEYEGEQVVILTNEGYHG